MRPNTALDDLNNLKARYKLYQDIVTGDKIRLNPLVYDTHESYNLTQNKRFKFEQKHIRCLDSLFEISKDQLTTKETKNMQSLANGRKSRYLKEGKVFS